VGHSHMVVGKRRPPSLSDAICAPPLADRPASSGGRGAGEVPLSSHHHHRELSQCLLRLRCDVDSALKRHQDELERFVDQQSAAFRNGGVRSAGSEGWRSAGSDAQLGIACGMPLPPSQTARTTPARLPPPPRGLTPVGNSEGHLGNNTKPVQHTSGMGESLDTTCCTASTRTPAWEHSMHSGQSVDVTEDEFDTARLPNCIGRSCETPKAPCSSWTVPSPPEVQPARLQVSDNSSSSSCKFDTDTIGKSSSKDSWRRSMAHSKSKALFSPICKQRMAMRESQQSKILRLTKSRWYELTSTLFIILNAIIVMWETDHRAKLVSEKLQGPSIDINQDELYFVLVACFFAAVFILDLVLRLIAERMLFIQSRDWAWNVFDFFVSLTLVAEVVVQLYRFAFATSTASNHVLMFLRKCSVLRILRLLRIIRTTRSIRVIRFIRELRLMVFSLTGSLKSLAWAVVLMLIILLFFGVIFTDGVVAYLEQSSEKGRDHTHHDLMTYFGSLSASTVSLYMAMSGGEDWATILRTLDGLPWEYRMLFLMFITFAVLALLNVVTAVFVGTAMQQSQADRDLIVQEELEHKGDFVTLMQQVFDEIDTNSSGALSLDEFEKHIEDDKILAYLRTLEIDVSQVRTLFTLLDVDNTGEVDVDEFVGGCLRLRGGATSMDLAVLKYQVEWILRGVQALHRALEQQRQQPAAAAANGGAPGGCAALLRG